MINNNELIDQIKSYNKFLNSESLNKAYNFALEAHQHQKREEGVPYIIHPVEVAKILTENLIVRLSQLVYYMTPLKIQT